MLENLFQQKQEYKFTTVYHKLTIKETMYIITENKANDKQDIMYFC